MGDNVEDTMLSLLKRQTEALEEIAQLLDDLLKSGVETLPAGQTSITKAWE